MHLQLGNIDYDYRRWLKSYMRHLKYKDVSINTLDVYKRILYQFQNFIEVQKQAKMLQEINREFFLDFIDYSEEHSKHGHFSKSTKQLYVSILKSFFIYISDNNYELYTFENEFKISLKSVKKGKKIKYLTDDEAFQIVDCLDNMRLNRGTYYDYIYSFGVKLMLFGGLRISEVLNLTLSDITISELRDENGNKDIYEVHLQETKAGVEQTALIKIEDVQEELLYFQELKYNDAYIFTSPKKITPLNRSNFYVSIGKVMKKAGIRKKGLHIFRHTCAMQLYRKSKDILVTKEKLRHSDIKTTMIYAHAEKSDVAVAMR
ncbi:MAG TPA: hypothetical protein EYG74_03310 [Sulfurimonas autotrophica]|nr:hypothetical protein [Sulfurimonas autotrophica]